MTYPRVCNTMGVTCGVGIAYPSRPAVCPRFSSGIRVVKLHVFVFIVPCCDALRFPGKNDVRFDLTPICFVAIGVS
jgi:hypothetical protein